MSKIAGAWEEYDFYSRAAHAERNPEIKRYYMSLAEDAARDARQAEREEIAQCRQP